MFEQAKWIWLNDGSESQYNRTVLLRRDFRMERGVAARLAITADSWYRLSVNGEWVNDGPARAYPERYSYDVLDILPYLRDGENRIEVLVRYFGCGTFHQLPLCGGLLAELRLEYAQGAPLTLVSDENWQAAPFAELVSNTAKNSVQRPPYEWRDARLSGAEFSPAAAHEPRHRGLAARETALLTRRPFPLRRFVGAALVQPEATVFTIPARQIYFPGTNSENSSDCLPLFVLLEIEAERAVEVAFEAPLFRLALNGAAVSGSSLSLRAGRNFIAAGLENMQWHPKDYTLSFTTVPGVRFRTPEAALWPDAALLAPDIPNNWANLPARQRRQQYELERDLLLAMGTPEAIRQRCSGEFRQLTAEELRLDAAHWSFRARRPAALPAGAVEHPENLIFGNAPTVIHPVPGGDIELCYDLGEENCGYFAFALRAAAGTVVDVAAVEYVTPDGVIQHTGHDYRNGMRYICREGENRIVSFERRAGRYCYMTLRNLAGDVQFRHFEWIESTYPVEPRGMFRCSDARLEAIWAICERTLKLCMEDTYTDCPLFEQTLWVGDARNEALFAFGTFGAYDLARRCIRLAGESLDRYPITGCQVPSGWDCLIPVWSFMWGLSVQDYYEETADTKFLAEVWPMVRKNLDGALQFIDERSGLFRIAEWNLFDWSRTETEHDVLIYNSMFLVGALDAGIGCARALGRGDTPDVRRFAAARENLAAAIRRVYDVRRGAWPDWIENGSPSDDTAVHTSLLAVLFGLEPDEAAARIRENVLNPPPEMIPVSSPFAALYYYMALEKLGAEQAILDTIYRDYLPMLALGSTTVWETFPGALNFMGPFPTRSHCHGWSAAPLYFLPRIVLGLKPAAPGGAAFIVSPHLPDQLDHAAGTRRTVRGDVSVRWKREAGTLVIDASAPAGVALEYRANPTHAGLEVVFHRIEG